MFTLRIVLVVFVSVLSASTSYGRGFQARTCDDCVIYPPLCLSDCVYFSPGDYAQNTIRRQIQEDANLFKRIVSEANKRSNNAWTGPNQQHLSWWIARGFRIDHVTQKIELSTPTLLKSEPGMIFRHPVISPNCAPNDLTIKRSTTDREKHELTKQEERTMTKTGQSEQFVKLNSSFGKAVSAEASSKITNSLQEIRKEVITKHTELENTVQQSQDIIIPPYSIATRTVIEKETIETYQVEGTVTMDAAITAQAILKTPIGRWSDYVSEDKRQFPISANLKVPVSTFIYRNDVHTYPTEQACLAAENAEFK